MMTCCSCASAAPQVKVYGKALSCCPDIQVSRVRSRVAGEGKVLMGFFTNTHIEAANGSELIMLRHCAESGVNMQIYMT